MKYVVAVAILQVEDNGEIIGVAPGDFHMSESVNHNKSDANEDLAQVLEVLEKGKSNVKIQGR